MVRVAAGAMRPAQLNRKKVSGVKHEAIAPRAYDIH